MEKEHLDRLESGILEIVAAINATRTMLPMWEPGSVYEQLTDVEKRCAFLLADVLALKVMFNVPITTLVAVWPHEKRGEKEP